MLSENDIKIEREKKIRSIFVDTVDSIVLEFNKKIMTSSKVIDKDKVSKALKFALSCNYGQGEFVKYYVSHPIRVSIFALDWMSHHDDWNTDFLVAAIIHNAIEKDVLTKSEIKEAYGDWCANTIEVLTQDRQLMKQLEHNVKYYEKIYSLNRYGQLLKFFDKLDNIFAISINPDADVRTAYLEEIE